MIGRSAKKRKNGDTALQRAKRANAAHLKDLRRAHGRPPRDVEVRRVAIPKRIEPEEVASYCSSPAQLCAELAQ